MITFLFTKNGLIGSRLIRQALGDDCSHFAFYKDGLVIESRMETGVQVSDYKKFLARNVVVHALHLKESDKVFEKQLWLSIEDHGQGRPYDGKAIAFWAAAVLANRWFNRPLPTSNKWGTMGSHTCVEILRGSERLVGDYLGVDLLARELEMTSPHMLYRTLRASKKLTPA